MREESTINIAGRLIGVDRPPYIVAEMSGNHGGNLDRALKIIKAAKEAGADAVKLQTYRADSITIDYDGPEFKIEKGLWAGRTLFELYGEAATPWDWHEDLFLYGRDIGITVFSSPFDNAAVQLLSDLDAPAYKISSFEIVDLPLITRVASLGKPIIISTGMASSLEIKEAVDTSTEAGASEIALLHCVSAYPTDPKDSHLRVIEQIRNEYKLVSGLSDHTLGNSTSIAAVALGASIIEKHFTLDRSEGGSDVAFSLEPDELKSLVEETRLTWEAMGNEIIGTLPAESESKRFRRSLYAVADIRKGMVISENQIRSIRPANGLPPKYLPDVLGRVAKSDISRGTPISWELLE